MIDWRRIGRRKSARLVSRPDGIWSTGVGRAQYSRRRQEPEDAIGHESQNQIQRVVQALCSFGAARESVRLLCYGYGQSLHAPGRPRVESRRTATHERAGIVMGNRSPQCAEIRHTGGNSRGLLRSGSNGARGYEPPLLQAYQSF